MITGRSGSPNRRRTQGLTIVELLIAASVVVLVLGLAAVFLGRQVQLQRNVQTQSSVQDTVRVASQLIAQDLALAGNRVISNDDGTTQDTPFGCYDSVTDTSECLSITDEGSAASELRMRYLSSQYPTSAACRDVAYRIQGGDLERSDLTCPNDTFATPAWRVVAPGVAAFKVVVICSDGDRFATYPNTACSPGSAYGRSALVTVAAESVGRSTSSGGATSMDVVTTDPDVVHTVDCPEGRRCFSLTQETLMPNLKDQ